VLARLLIVLPRVESVNLNLNQSNTKSRRAYVRMVRRQHTPLSFKRLLLHHQSIFVPTKGKVRVGEMAHCLA
jgi:hypothetical protein